MALEGVGTSDGIGARRARLNIAFGRARHTKAQKARRGERWRELWFRRKRDQAERCPFGALGQLERCGRSSGCSGAASAQHDNRVNGARARRQRAHRTRPVRAPTPPLGRRTPSRAVRTNSAQRHHAFRSCAAFKRVSRDQEASITSSDKET